MKAWMTFDTDETDGCLLVYAETRNKARSVASRGIWEDWEYISITARRAKNFDKYYKGINCIEDNDELPDGAPNFYSDTELWGDG